jgi:hypothetical protein
LLFTPWQLILFYRIEPTLPLVVQFFPDFSLLATAYLAKAEWATDGCRSGALKKHIFIA